MIGRAIRDRVVRQVKREVSQGVTKLTMIHKQRGDDTHYKFPAQTPVAVEVMVVIELLISRRVQRPLKEHLNEYFRRLNDT